jgi:hypothetical protein
VIKEATRLPIPSREEGYGALLPQHGQGQWTKSSLVATVGLRSDVHVGEGVSLTERPWAEEAITA